MATVKVPTVDKSKRIPQKASNQVEGWFVEKFKLQKPKGSPLDVDGIDTKLSQQEILQSIEEGRKIF